MTDPAAPSTGDLRNWLIDQIAEICELGAEEIDTRKPLDEYGLSSRDAVELSGSLEDWLDVTLPSTLIWDHPTIESLASALTSTNEPTPGPRTDAGYAGTSDEPIAVVGVGCRFPGGAHGPERFWRLLTEGTDAIAEVPSTRWSEHPTVPEGTSRWGGFLDDIAGFDAEFFGIAPREAARMDPQQRMVLEVAWEALEHAGIAAESLRGSDTGVFIGISGTEYGARALNDASTVDPWVGTGSALSIAANRLSYVLDLRGPSMSVDTACSSSLTSVHLAANSLRTGESSVALVGGANLLLGPAITASFDQMGLTSTDGRCKPFSADADGISRAEGAGVVVLKRLSEAHADSDRVLAVIRGAATNSDGRSNGLTAPNPEAQQALLRQACDTAGIRPDTVDYVEAHGTGTLLGDPIEARALGAVLGSGRSNQDPLLIGSVKSNLGHLEAAAGIAGLIKVALSLHHNELPATLNYSAPNPHIPFAELGVSVVDSSRAWPDTGRPSIAGVSGFGFGGTNAHVLLEQAEPPARAIRETRYRRYQLGGADESRIADLARGLADWLDNDGANADLADLEYTFARRCSGRRRGAVVANNTAALAEGLRGLAKGRPSPAVVPPSTTQEASAKDAPVFVFSGHGSQWAGMGQQLLRDEPVFVSAITRLDPLIREHAGFSPLEDLRAGFDATTMDRVQPLVFSIQVALAQLWRAYGVEPGAVIGHSFGEVSAAVVAGAITEAEGAKIVALRSRLLASLAGDGAMALLEVDVDEATRLVEALPDVDVAVVSSPTQTVIAGSAGQVGNIVAEVDSRGLLAKLINLDVAAHSPVVDAVTDTLADGLTDLRPHAAPINFYSTTLPELPDAPHFDAHYWAQNLRRPVRFASAVETALRRGHRAFIELAPRPVLRHALEDNFSWHTDNSPLVLDTLRKCANETEHFHTQLAALELASASTPETSGGRLVDMPTTPWRHEWHWQPHAPAAPNHTGEHPLLGTHVEIPDETRHLWRADLGSSAHPWLGDHQIGGRAVLTASAYAEMVNAAARHVFDVAAEQVVVRELELHQPLPLTDTTSVTTVLTPGAHGDTAVTVHTRSDDGSWTQHAGATAVLAGSCSDATRGKSPELDSSTFGEVAVSDVYARLRAIGVHYGPAFHGMSAVRTARDGGDSCAVARIRLPEAALADSRLQLHPAIVDSCMQVVAAALLEQDPAADAVYLPSHFGVISVHGDVTTAAYAQVWTRSSEQQSAQWGQLRLCDDADRVLLEANDIVVHKLDADTFAAPLSEQLLETTWQPAELTERRTPSSPVLVLGPAAHPRAKAIAAALSETGVPSGWADYSDAEHVTAAIHAYRPGSIVFLLPEHGTGLDALDDAEHALLAVAGTVATLTEGDGSTQTRLWMVTAGAAALPDDDAVHPAGAALRGLVRVLAYEHPELHTSIVDLEWNRDNQLAAENLVTELGTGTDDEVALRGAQRYVRRLAWIGDTENGDDSSVAKPDVPLARGDGGYVITGGLGGLGIALASWLANNGAGRIVLNGRSAPGAHARHAINEISERTNTEVEIVLGDVAEAGVAESLLASVQSDAIAPRGIIHAAAVFDDRTTTQLDADTVHRSWWAKARGAWRLHEATVEIDLDWWVGFSSAAALHGLPGQPAYACANAYLDALVAMRRKRGLPAVSVSWGLWALIGAAAELDIPWLRPIDPGECFEVLADAIGSHRTGIGAVRLNTDRLVAAFPQLAGAEFFSELLGEAELAQQHATDWAGLDGLRALDVTAASRMASAQLRTRIASVLGFADDQLDVHAPLPALGLDSLLAVRIRNAVAHDFELSLPVALLLRGASIIEVEHWLLAELGISGGAVQPASQPVSGSIGRTLIPPRDAAERLVTTAWQEILGIDVGVTEDFYGLGGTRQRAEQITAWLAERSGRELTISELFEHPSIERMAAHLREHEHHAGASPVRTLRTGTGTGNAPLFFFHPGGGDTAVYKQLAELLDPELVVYGFDRIEGVADIEDRVREYLPELRSRQPHGPYRVAGWSFGGFLAFEMAQQLRQAGEQVEIVAMMDSIIPLPNQTGLSDVELLERRFQRFEEFLESSYGRKIDLPYERLAQLDDEDQVQLLIDTMLAEGLVNSAVSDAILHHQRTSFLDARSLERYRPEPYDGRVVFFSAADLVPGGLRDQRFDRSDPARGWDSVCTDLELVTVSGHHLSMLDPPNVDQIGKHLDKILATTPHLLGTRNV